MEIIIGLLVVVLDIIALLSIIASSFSPLKKLVWILVIFILPVIGVLLWYLLGNPGRDDVRVKMDRSGD